LLAGFLMNLIVCMVIFINRYIQIIQYIRERKEQAFDQKAVSTGYTV